MMMMMMTACSVLINRPTQPTWKHVLSVISTQIFTGIHTGRNIETLDIHAGNDGGANYQTGKQAGRQA